MRGIDFGADEIVLRFDGTVERASAFVVDGPNRLAIDIKGAVAGTGGGSSDLVSSIRHGQYDAATARVVLSLTRPVVITGGQFSQDGRALVLSVASATAESFKSAVRTGRKTFASPLSLGLFNPPARSGITVPLGPPQGDEFARVTARTGRPRHQPTAGRDRCRAWRP